MEVNNSLHFNPYATQPISRLYPFIEHIYFVSIAISPLIIFSISWGGLKFDRIFIQSKNYCYQKK